MSTIQKYRNYRNRRNAALAARIVGHTGTTPMSDTMRDEMMYLRIRIM